VKIYFKKSLGAVDINFVRLIETSSVDAKHGLEVAHGSEDTSRDFARRTARLAVGPASLARLSSMTLSKLE
jgi:hypothetical protein